MRNLIGSLLLAFVLGAIVVIPLVIAAHNRPEGDTMYLRGKGSTYTRSIELAPGSYTLEYRADFFIRLPVTGIVTAEVLSGECDAGEVLNLRSRTERTAETVYSSGGCRVRFGVAYGAGAWSVLVKPIG